MNNIALSFNNVTCGYKNNNVLNNISIDIESGKIHVLIGNNGSGKTTFLKAATGRIKTFSGDVFLRGCNINKMNETDISKTASSVFRFESEIPDFTVFQFLEMHTNSFLSNLKSKNNIRSEIYSAGKECSTDIYFTKKLNELSSGELQLVQITGAIIRNRNFIILDEPVAHLDPGHTVMILKLLRNLNNQGSTIITVLHDINTALNFADTITAIHNGKIFFSGSTDEFYNGNYFQKLYNINYSKTTLSENKYFLF